MPNDGGCDGNPTENEQVQPDETGDNRAGCPETETENATDAATVSEDKGEYVDEDSAEDENGTEKPKKKKWFFW